MNSNRLWISVLMICLILTSIQPAPSSAKHAPDVQMEMADGSETVWTARKVNVRIFTNAYWQPLVAEAVAGIEAAMPPKGPRLRIIHEPERSCDWVNKQRYSQPTITVCSKDESWYAGSASLVKDHHIIAKERVYLTVITDHDLDFDRNTACHEMMHAVSWVNDNYAYTQDSCVQGMRVDPGPWDVAYLAQVYQRHDTKAERKRTERRDDRKDERRQNGRRGGKHGGRR